MFEPFADFDVEFPLYKITTMNYKLYRFFWDIHLIPNKHFS